MLVATSTRWWATCPVALFRDLHAATPNFVAQFATVLCSPKAFKLNIHRIKRIVLFRFADGRVDDLLFMRLADGRELGR